MAVKISALPAAIAAAAANIFAVVQSGTTRQVALSAIAAWIQQTYAGFTQTGSGAVANTPEDTFQQLPWVNLLDFCSDAKREAIIAGTQTDVTAELILAVATKKKVVGPKGLYQISSPVSVEVDLQFAGTGAGGTPAYSKFVLTSTGQLQVDQVRLHWSGFIVESAVASLTFIKVRQGYFRFDNFTILQGANNQILFELDTTTASGIGHCSFDKFLLGQVNPGGWTGVTHFKLTGTSFVNDCKFGERGDSWQGFTTAIDVQNTGGTQVNSVGGYCETAVNNSDIIKVAASCTFTNNIMTTWIDGTGGATVYAINNAGTFGENTWVGLPPEYTLSRGAVAPVVQQVTEKILVRAALTVNQTGVVDDTFTKIVFDSITYDTSGLVVFATGRFTAPRPMRIKVYAKTNINTNLADQDLVAIALYKNGAAAGATTTNYLSGSVAPDVQVSDDIVLAKNDYIEVFAKANQAAGSGAHVIESGVTYVTFKEL